MEVKSDLLASMVLLEIGGSRFSGNTYQHGTLTFHKSERLVAPYPDYGVFAGFGHRLFGNADVEFGCYADYCRGAYNPPRLESESVDTSSAGSLRQTPLCLASLAQ